MPIPAKHSPPPAKCSQVLYHLTKCAARNGFTDFLENIDVTPAEWDEIKRWFADHGIESYP